jgi:hypothetical protein
MAPHDEIPAVTSSGKKGSAAMRTSVTVAYLINNAPIRPNREICIIDTHPGLFDAVSLTDLLSVATSTYQLLQGNSPPLVQQSFRCSERRTMEEHDRLND